MAKAKLIHPIVKVYWNDACGQRGWLPVGQALHRAVETISVGYMVKKTKDGVTVVGTLNDQGDCNDVCFVPAGMVTKIEVLQK